MSDTWYRNRPQLEPFVDGFGRRWTLDGQCLDVEPDPGPSWLDDWPEDLQSVAFGAALVMAFRDEYFRLLDLS